MGALWTMSEIDIREGEKRLRQISFCGIDCNECPAFLATQEDNDEERVKIAELWSCKYNSDIKPEDINCDGCLSEGGRRFNYCRVCEVRTCCQERHIKNCACCDEYACEKLSPIFEVASHTRITLDEIRKNL
jgi:hypothetical protein